VTRLPSKDEWALAGPGEIARGTSFRWWGRLALGSERNTWGFQKKFGGREPAKALAELEKERRYGSASRTQRKVRQRACATRKFPAWDDRSPSRSQQRVKSWKKTIIHNRIYFSEKPRASGPRGLARGSTYFSGSLLVPSAFVTRGGWRSAVNTRFELYKSSCMYSHTYRIRVFSFIQIESECSFATCRKRNASLILVFPLIPRGIVVKINENKIKKISYILLIVIPRFQSPIFWKNSIDMHSIDPRAEANWDGSLTCVGGRARNFKLNVFYEQFLHFHAFSYFHTYYAEIWQSMQFKHWSSYNK
jgi:hypothetical protein